MPAEPAPPARVLAQDETAEAPGIASDHSARAAEELFRPGGQPIFVPPRALRMQGENSTALDLTMSEEVAS